MISAGNDIIALNHIDIRRTKQERFYTKFLLPGEVEWYAGNNLCKLSLENFIWLLWSVKESVYKFCKRNSPQLVFSPLRIMIQSLQEPPKNNSPSFGTGEIAAISLIKKECYHCIITTDLGTFYSRSKIYHEVIYTVVNNTDNFDSMYWGIKYVDSALPTRQSEDVRLFILQKLNEIYPNAALCITKDAAGCPILKVDEKEMNIAISFTHHDRFVGYAFNY